MNRSYKNKTSKVILSLLLGIAGFACTAGGSTDAASTANTTKQYRSYEFNSILSSIGTVDHCFAEATRPADASNTGLEETPGGATEFINRCYAVGGQLAATRSVETAFYTDTLSFPSAEATREDDGYFCADIVGNYGALECVVPASAEEIKAAQDAELESLDRSDNYQEEDSSDLWD